MSDEANDNACSGCPAARSDSAEPQDLTQKPHEQSHIKKVIGVVSGKGGVGKSLVTSLLSSAMNRRGHSVAILDADVTGPSIPKAFGVNEKLRANVSGILPSVTESGIQMVSTNLMLPDDTTPVIWRGAIISGTVRQFWSEVLWGDIDYMFIDMPPGTGDVPLTVFQSLPVDGIVIVTAPQDLVSMIVSKAVNMAENMNIPILGLIENMSYFECPDCGSRHAIFGEGNIERIAAEHGITLMAKLPILPAISALVDAGRVEEVDTTPFDSFVDALEKV